MTSSKQLQDKVAVITGAGRGIGRSIALGFAEEGAHVVAVSRTQSEIDAVAQEASKFNVKSLAIRTDIIQEEQVEEMVKRTLAAFDRIDILVNDAGISGPTDFITEIKTKDWDTTLNINLRGMFFCARAVLPQMIKQKRGNIINVTSGAGYRTKDQVFLSPTRSLVYSVSKHGVQGFTTALAAQVNKYNINVNALSPGPIDTKGQHRNASPAKKLLVRDNPDCIKGVAIYLASQGPRGITGETVYSLTWDKIYLDRDLTSE